uniref:receptor-interacting serine/threonine-protein kinase 3-like isoform X2 n=1 Tax=Monopterus albus TaxID=43700 RepID=UPI0009B49B7C|nr:receptor-interacting serine/threonine-protein kinase 3-like isoform X2 [Monopterus albus]
MLSVEMALSSRMNQLVRSESLERWVFIDSGGFGTVYKARHKDWGFDVAVKLLNDGSTLCEEAKHMDMVSCEFVLRVYGIFEGFGPWKEPSMQKGIVMEFMRRGSVKDLQKTLSGPPPWPLAFRLAHQVALGMNFLHLKDLVHSDLKPSNVLLNDDLNAKIADFGLSRVSTSALNSNSETGEAGGSYMYMPPEAFTASYKPVRAFDIYSYGILLWSIATGKEPYPNACYSLVELNIPRGDRPSLEDIDHKVEGLKELVDLMKWCWDGNPLKRPKFTDCIDVTENLFSKHEKGIHDAVYRVAKPDSKTSNQQPNTSGTFSCSSQTPDDAVCEFKQSKYDIVDHIKKTETSSTQASVHVSTQRMSDKDKATFVDGNRATLIQAVSEVMVIVDKLGNMVHSETYSVIEAHLTSQEKMRDLYQRVFRPGGVKVKAAFYDILREDHPHLVERLGGKH